MEPMETEHAEGNSSEDSRPADFQQKKRIWTVVFVCALLVSVIAACIRATDEPAAPNVAVASTPTATGVAEPTATTEQTITTTDTQTKTAEPVASAQVSDTTSVNGTAVVTETTSVSATTGVNETSATTTSDGPPAAAASSGSPSTATVSDEYNGIPVGFTSEGYPFRGNPDAPVTMYEYSDYQCPFCSRYFVQTEPAINESYVRSGQVRVIFRDFPLEGLHPNAPAAHEAANCIGDQGAKLYWGMHDQLFRSQREWSQAPDPLTIFKRLAEEIGADVTQYDTCIARGAKKASVTQGIVEANELGYQGTPSFRFVSTASGEGYDLIGAQPYDQFSGFIEAIAAGQVPTGAQAQTEGESGGGGDGSIPQWATAEGLKPDPNQPGKTMAGDSYRGDPNAAVVVVEFSDFQCPYCIRHVTGTQPVLDETFVTTNKVMWVFKHFPLSFHPQAFAAAVASECAADQSKFWEMHDLLFSDVASWSFDPPTQVFSSYAKQLDLDITAFDACQQAEESQARVKSDMNDGSQFVRGTPSFIILKGGQGRIIPGALPKDEFVSALQEIVDTGFTQ